MGHVGRSKIAESVDSATWSTFTSILKVSEFSWKNVGGVGFLEIATWAKWDFEIIHGHFCVCWRLKWSNLKSLSQKMWPKWPIFGPK